MRNEGIADQPETKPQTPEARDALQACLENGSRLNLPEAFAQARESENPAEELYLLLERFQALRRLNFGLLQAEADFDPHYYQEVVDNWKERGLLGEEPHPIFNDSNPESLKWAAEAGGQIAQIAARTTEQLTEWRRLHREFSFIAEDKPPFFDDLRRSFLILGDLGEAVEREAKEPYGAPPHFVQQMSRELIDCRRRLVVRRILSPEYAQEVEALKEAMQTESYPLPQITGLPQDEVVGVEELLELTQNELPPPFIRLAKRAEFKRANALDLERRRKETRIEEDGEFHGRWSKTGEFEGWFEVNIYGEFFFERGMRPLLEGAPAAAASVRKSTIIGIYLHEYAHGIYENLTLQEMRAYAELGARIPDDLTPHTAGIAERGERAVKKAREIRYHTPSRAKEMLNQTKLTAARVLNREKFCNSLALLAYHPGYLAMRSPEAYRHFRELLATNMPQERQEKYRERKDQEAVKLITTAHEALNKPKSKTKEGGEK